MPDEPESKSYEERRARYAKMWVVYMDSPLNRELAAAWARAVRSCVPQTPPEPEAGTWRDRPPLL